MNHLPQVFEETQSSRFNGGFYSLHIKMNTNRAATIFVVNKAQFTFLMRKHKPHWVVSK